MSAHRTCRATALAGIPAAALIAAHGGTMSTSALLARGRRSAAPSMARGLVLAAAVAGTIATGAGVASAAPLTPSHSIAEAQTKAEAQDGDPNAGIPTMDQAVVVGDVDNAADGAVEFGIPTIFTLCLILAF